MTDRGASLETVKDHVQTAAEDAVQEARPWVERLTRLGFVAKAVVYITIGALATQAAFGFGGEKTDPPGAIQQLSEYRGGEWLVGLLAIGLIGYALLRLIQAALDTEGKGSDLKGWAQRGGYLASGVTYLAFAFIAARRLIAGDRIDTSDAVNEVTARVLLNPVGELLIGLAGAIGIGVGLYQFYRAYTADFCEKYQRQTMSETQFRLAVLIGRFGFAARGVVFGAIGVFLIIAALRSDADQAEGLGGALERLSQQPHGTWILALVALGLIAHGISMLVNARYRRSVLPA